MKHLNIRRINGYLLDRDSEKLEENNKLRILDVGGTRFRVKNTGNDLTIEGIRLHFDGNGKLTVLRDSTDIVHLNSFDELKKIVNRYRMMYKKALVFSKQLQIEKDFYG